MSHITHLVWKKVREVEKKRIPGLFQWGVVKQSLGVLRRSNNLEEIQISGYCLMF